MCFSHGWNPEGPGGPEVPGGAEVREDRKVRLRAGFERVKSRLDQAAVWRHA